MEQNPKSVLRGKHHMSLDHYPFTTNDHSSLRVTFAKASTKNQSNQSSTISMNPSLPGAKVGTPLVPARRPHNKSNIDTIGMEAKPKTAPVTPAMPTRPVMRPGSPVAGSSGNSNRATAKPTENRKPKMTPKLSNESVSSSGTGSQKKGEDLSNLIHTSKSKRHLKKSLRSSTKSVAGGLQHTKSGKKLKKKKSKREDKMETETFQPAPLNAEYASELGKITQILKAVTAFDGSENSTIPAGISSRVKITSMTANNHAAAAAVPSSTGHNMHRPLSAEELKQLLSSITRVVSLHQLPVTEQDQTSITPISTLSEKEISSSLAKFAKSKKGMKKNVLPSYMAGTYNREAVRTQSVISTRVTRSKPGKKVKVGRKGNRKRRDASEASSISSLDKDPVKNAAFLKKYFEESTRLAEKRSSELLVVTGEAVKEMPLERPRSKKKGKKLSSSKKGVVDSAAAKTLAASAKKSSQTSVSILTGKKKSQQSATTTKARKSVKMHGSNDSLKKNAGKKPPPTQTEGTANVQLENNAADKSNKLQQDISKKKLTTSKISNTAVAGSPKQRSRTSSQQELALDASNRGKPSTPRTPIIDQMVNVTLRKQQQEFKNIEEVINSKFTGNTAKMKSIWEKTPYQPMTHARFRDMVSNYASPEANAAFAKAEEASKSLQTNNVKVPSSFTRAGNLSTPPTHWAMKERLAETAPNDKTVTLLRGPPNKWQADTSRMTTNYNRVNYFKTKLRRDARQIRKRIPTDANEKTRPMTSKDGHPVGGGAAGGAQGNIHEALNYYKALLKRNAVSK